MGRLCKPALLSWTRGFLLSRTSPSLQKKASLTNNRSSKDYRNLTRLGKIGNPTSNTHRRRSRASSVIPTPPWIPSYLQTPLRTSMVLHTTEMPCGQQQPGGTPRFLHQALSLRTTSSSPSEESWTTWRPRRPTTRLFLNSLSRPRQLSTRQSRRSCMS